MSSRAKKFVLIGTLVLALAFLLAFTASAFAYPGINSSSDKRYAGAPGLTERTIYGSCQVFMYKLPAITHVGYVHIEMTYKYPDYDAYVYLMGPDGMIAGSSETETQGYNSDYKGKEIVDFRIPSITNQNLNADGTDIDGDQYYVMVQAFDDVSNFQINGYVPKLWLEGGANVDDMVGGNWYRENVKYPADGSFKKIYGAPYGGAFDFTPTSEGKTYMQLRFPFDPVAKIPGGYGAPGTDYTDVTKRLANMEQYIYPTDWSEDGAIWDYDEYGTAHWAQKAVMNFVPPAIDTTAGNSSWKRGLEYKFDIGRGTYKAPNDTLHYIPVLWEVSNDSSMTIQNAGPKTGLQTIGYRASLVYPQNNYLSSVPSSKVAKGAKATMKGSLAIDPGWVNPADPGAGTVAWAPAGVKVQLQYEKNGGWINAGTATVSGSEGAWSGTVKPTSDHRYRAYWVGTQAQDCTVTARKMVDPGTGYAWDAKFTSNVFAGNAIWSDGSVDIWVDSIDATLMPAQGSIVVKSSNLVGGNPWSATLTKAAPMVDVAFDSNPAQHYEITYKSVNLFSENSLKKWIYVK